VLIASLLPYGIITRYRVKWQSARSRAPLADRRRTSVILLVRSTAAREELRGRGLEHVIATDGENSETELGELATQLQATAVFDGVGGELISRTASHLPMNATICLYGFLAGSTPISISSRIFVARNLVMKRCGITSTQYRKLNDIHIRLRR
jgi:NADPH:quinone reductase